MNLETVLARETIYNIRDDLSPNNLERWRSMWPIRSVAYYDVSEEVGPMYARIKDEGQRCRLTPED